MKTGKITKEIGALPEKHELATIDYLAKHLGEDIVILAPNRQKGAHTPDIRMGNFEWEIKSPKGHSSRTIENNIRTASKQSQSIIFDLHRAGFPDQKCIAMLEGEFWMRTTIKRLIVIPKIGKPIVFNKKT